MKTKHLTVDNVVKGVSDYYKEQRAKRPVIKQAELLRRIGNCVVDCAEHSYVPRSLTKEECDYIDLDKIVSEEECACSTLLRYVGILLRSSTGEPPSPRAIAALLDAIATVTLDYWDSSPAAADYTVTDDLRAIALHIGNHYE